ncbi:hypothetical protein J437_LFUL014604 [Ladona fulva]|uniref:Major facilitator superfamily (MFS) profile domain-containing protein n=1 Tax=Ladona fulva TaxID=123851 RepID=A0A8K0P8C8_LADFU|nr:hypothetical protein J437_LFUL014604 [Ladona fulva]
MNLSEMNLLWSVIVSAPLITGMFGSLFSGYFADRYGRKWTLFHCLAIQTVAGILLISSRWALSFEMLLVARLLLGFAGGLATGVSPMYLTEIAPSNLRGTMGVLCPMGLSTGVFIAQILGFKLSRLRNLGHKKLLEELVELNLGIPYQGNDKRKGFGLLELLQSHSLRLPLLIVMSMQAGQQLSGINAVFYYSMIIFERAGLGKFGSEFASVCAGGVNLAMALVSPWLVGRYTRRGLILISCYSAATCILMLIIIILLIDYLWWMPYLSIVAVLAFVFCYGLGLGPLPFFIGAELFEIEPRPMAMALGSLANWGGNFLVGVTFPLLQQWLGPWAFATFVLSSLALAEFLKRKLPETKGLDPIQVSHLFSQ